MSARRPLHKVAHKECPNDASNWADCDKVREDKYTDWQAFQQVLAAYIIAKREADLDGKPVGYREKNLFDQLVRLVRGQQQDLMTDEGNPNVGPWAMRLRAALARFKAGDLPRYNLYRVPGIEPGPDTYWTPTTGPYARKEVIMAHDTDVAPETESASTVVSEDRPQPGAFETAPKFAPPADEADGEEDTD